ncbi:hypothetical protein [Dyadobacter tibetensis]|uniref:hypothetical protein n=1 Tax=Dyadobacter tibetensis TaxID=1211851 RepID=UPI0004705310|nr:hypothetical protein [Dyadobacter tibetensis]
MNEMDRLKAKLADLMVMNHGDINVMEHPQILATAQDLGLDLGRLNQLIQQIYAQIDWKPYQIIDTKLALILRKGIITEEQLNDIIVAVDGQLSPRVTEDYVLSEIQKNGFTPREINDPNPLSIKNMWMTDAVWPRYQESLVEVEWLGEKASNLGQLGAISYRKKEDAKYFLRNGNYLPSLITALTKSASQADAYARIIEEELDSEKRYLRIVYKLNPDLPFLFQDNEYHDVGHLFVAASSTPSGFYALWESYKEGMLQVWIEETDSEVAKRITEQRNLNSFLRLLYQTDPNLPFSLGGICFSSPAALCQYAKENFNIWPTIAGAIRKKNIQEWFEALGKQEWNNHLEYSEQFITESGYYSEQQIPLGLVQALFYIIDPQSERPKLTAEPEKVALHSIKGGVSVEQTIQLKLLDSGYIQAKAMLRQAPAGIQISPSNLEFNSLEDKTQESISLVIDSTVLQKEQLYSMEIVVSTVYQDLLIPVEVKVVFPKEAYIQKLALYSILTAGYFGIFRFLLSVITGTKDWLITGRPSGMAISESPLLSFFLMALFLFGGIIAYQLIKKFEKI